MIFLEPEQCVGNKEICHLGTPVIINQRSPVRMLSLPRIQVLVQTGAIKPRQPVFILWKMSRYPVQNNPNPIHMHLVHKIHKILRRAIPGCRCKISRHLVSPRGIVRMLHNRHHFYMRVSHVFTVFHKHRRQFPVTIKFFPAGFAEGPEMYLINNHWVVLNLCLFSSVQPFPILPFIFTNIPHNTGRRRTLFTIISERIRFQHHLAVRTMYLILIQVPRRSALDKQFKNAGRKPLHRMLSAVPAIKIPDNADRHCIWRPHGKADPSTAPHFTQVRPKLFINRIMSPALKHRLVHSVHKFIR